MSVLGAAEQMGINNLMNSNQNRNRNTQRLLNLSLFLICLSVVISWFFRYRETLRLYWHHIQLIENIAFAFAGFNIFNYFRGIQLLD